MANILRPLSQGILNLNLDINTARNTNNQMQICNPKDIKDSLESVVSQINFKTCTCHRLAKCYSHSHTSLPPSILWFLSI
jgi:hypothetical protein